MSLANGREEGGHVIDGVYAIVREHLGEVGGVGDVDPLKRARIAQLPGGGRAVHPGDHAVGPVALAEGQGEL